MRRRPRVAAERAAYATRNDPAAYISDILGWTLTGDQGQALYLMATETRLLLPSGNNLGKTFLGAGYAVYWMDAVGAQLDEEGREQGARVLLVGPSHASIFATVYSEILAHLARATSRGFAMPGTWSERSVLWKVAPKYELEAFSPPASVQEQVAHKASGRHHRNLLALIEEGQGVQERLWKAVHGMCSGEGNKIISPFNPTEPAGPAYQRGKGSYRVFHLDAFRHPNVTRRSSVIPGAVNHLVIDDRVRDDCRNRGAYPAVQPESDSGDFLYALPRLGQDEVGPREDGVPGHPVAAVHVFRPSASFQAQVRGQWPAESDYGLFSPGAWDRAVRRWLATEDPTDAPDRVGLDVAREGEDETCAAPSWGADADTLLRAFHQAQLDGAAEWKGERVRVGELKVFPRGRGPTVAEGVAQVFQRSPWMVDETGVGASVLDHAKDVLGLEVYGVSFGAAAPERLPGQQRVLNVRAALYVIAAMLVERDLVDLPDDPLLREEVLAHETRPAEITEELPDGRKERKPAVRILEKDEVKKKIGRSPDRADAFVLSLWRPLRRKRRGSWGFSSGG